MTNSFMTALSVVIRGSSPPTALGPKCKDGFDFMFYSTMQNVIHVSARSGQYVQEDLRVNRALVMHVQRIQINTGSTYRTDQIPTPYIYPSG